MKKNKAIFLDRDGTIIQDKKYMHKINDLEFISNSLDALKKFQEHGYLLIIITNQSGIERNYFSIEDYHKFQKEFLKKLKKEGIKISNTYFCPHTPENDCECRKPKTKFIEDAVKEFDINLSKSWIIGDKISDILLSKDNELRSILISNQSISKKEFKPTYFLKDLLEAADIISD